MTPEELAEHELSVHFLGGPDDPWLEEGRGSFPSTTTARAERYFAEHGKPMQIYSRGHLVIDFIENDLLLGSGSYAGKPFRLMHWQKRMLIEMYEVTLQETYDIDLDDKVMRWMRKHRWSYIQIPKKNGKTEIAAGLGLYHLVAEQDAISPNIVCAAASEEQADLVFGAASNMSGWSDIASVVSVKTRKIEAMHNLGEFHRLAAVSGSNDGKNISTTIIDELHEWLKPNARSIFDVITQGGGARPEYYNIMITTPGFDQDSICYEFYVAVKDMIDQGKEDETLYGLIFEAPEDADHTDPETWRIANPSYGKLVHEPFFRDMLTKKTEAVFRRYFCGQWTEAEEVWEVAQYWDARIGSFEFDPEEPVYVGIDIGLSHDTSCVAHSQWNKELSKVLIEFKIWANPYARRSSMYTSWELDIGEVEQHLRDLYDKFPKSAMMNEEDDYKAPGPSYHYDPHFFSRSAQILSAEGLNMWKANQSNTIMVPVSQRFFELVKADEIMHRGDPVVRKHIRSVVPSVTERGWRINKTKATKAIDAAIGGAISAFYCSENTGDGYDDAPNIW